MSDATWQDIITASTRPNDKHQQAVLDLAGRLCGDKYVDVLRLTAEKLQIVASDSYRLERAIADSMEQLKVRNTFPDKGE